MGIAHEYSLGQRYLALARKVAHGDTGDLQPQPGAGLDRVRLLANELDERSADVAATQNTDSNMIAVKCHARRLRGPATVPKPFRVVNRRGSLSLSPCRGVCHAGGMRFIIYGAGGIGGVVGGRLAQSGHEVTLIARGRHAAAMRAEGLRLESPAGTDVVRLPVVERPSEITFGPDDVVLVAVKSQDSAAVFDALALAAGPGLPVVCLQNGVENERMALRRFRNVYAVPVVCPTGHLQPGVVTAYSAPVTGIFDIGRYPTGSDTMCQAVSSALAVSTFSSEVRDDVMRWKWSKLLSNLGNAIEAICGAIDAGSRLAPMARSEGEAVLHAAGIDFASQDEEQARRGDLRLRPVDGERRGGGSSWQSLMRGVGSIETDHLNGEIALLGRLYGVPTPVNETLQRIAVRLAADHAAPGSLSEDEVLAMIDAVH